MIFNLISATEYREVSTKRATLKYFDNLFNDLDIRIIVAL